MGRSNGWDREGFGVLGRRAAACPPPFLSFLITLFILFGDVWLFIKVKLSTLEEKRGK